MGFSGNADWVLAFLRTAESARGNRDSQTNWTELLLMSLQPNLPTNETLDVKLVEHMRPLKRTPLLRSR